LNFSSIVLGIATIATSGVVSVIVTYRLNGRREERQFRRQRLEHLFKAYIGFCRNLEVQWTPYAQVMLGKLNYNQALDMTIAGGKDQERNLEEAEMLVAIYWPQLQAHLDALLKVRNSLAEIAAVHKESYRSGNVVDPEAHSKMLEAFSRLDGVRWDFRSAAHAEAMALSRAMPAGTTK
jgi:hypothetical protein